VKQVDGRHGRMLRGRVVPGGPVAPAGIRRAVR
jgi:hypothetical protein